MTPLSDSDFSRVLELRAERWQWAEIHAEMNLDGDAHSLRCHVNNRVRKQVKPAIIKHFDKPHDPPPSLPRSHAAVLTAPDFPKSLAVEWGRHLLQGRTIGVLSDIHIPYHDEAAVVSAVDHLALRGIDTLLLNGDVVDFYQGSRFTRYPTKASIKRELELAKQFLHWLRGRFPDIEIIWKLGNHEERWYTYIAERAPEVFELVSNMWFDVVGAKEHGVTMIGEQARIYAGKLLILHGHELGRGTSTPVNPARTLALRALESGLIGHFHRTSENSMHTVSGNSIVTRSTGCLCALSPDYARINQWDHGFAVVTVESGGDYSCELKKIINGKVY